MSLVELKNLTATEAVLLAVQAGGELVSTHHVFGADQKYLAENRIVAVISYFGPLYEGETLFVFQRLDRTVWFDSTGEQDCQYVLTNTLLRVASLPLVPPQER